MRQYHHRDGILVSLSRGKPPCAHRARPGKLVIEKGFIKGFVDLVVEHDGRVYFADWKSDVLPSYEPEMIAEHVDAHYDTQVKLYSLALVKALKIQSEAEYERLIRRSFLRLSPCLATSRRRSRKASISTGRPGPRSCSTRPNSNESTHGPKGEAHERADQFIASRYRP